MIQNCKDTFSFHRQYSGFTLIEVMVVVAIIGILSAIAMPAYNGYVLRGKLTEAFATLADTRVKLEQYYQDNRSYAGACATGTSVPLPTGKYFVFSCPTLSTTAFSVVATGVAAQGTGGFVYTINDANVQGTSTVGSGWSGTGATCWVRRKDGSC
ncbi:type IV pilin protein [Sulfurirhabdus autotrophica]|uniref:Type IV pilus assembly protein PilE n=1 Tax=Sulfurirhabdus autotrophica TaxID=1706046 RepID=A0A4R3YB05_9PROT|nr:type IV pilin protein [Sulfurirhabdus autotrophica]TCV88952.1 type IV pilus assembly protein PilE [Sulfurirhabdus autotrophica]